MPDPGTPAVHKPIPKTVAVPVIVELFTSEGCSSCPPADELMAKLEREQPIPGIEIIPLEEHVDYWDSAAWRDPFSSRVLTNRQADYGRLLKIDDVYTPQAVVGGQIPVSGSDARALREAITRAAQTVKASVEVTFQSASLARVRVDNVPPGAGVSDVMMAVTENRLSSTVKGGENQGRTLAHSGVVRSIVSLGRVAPSTPAVFSMHLRFSPQWKRDDLRYVIFVQDRTTRRIWGATAVYP